MNLEDIKPISYIKTNAASMVAQVGKSKRPIIITQNGNAKAVLIGTEEYQNMINALGLLKLITQSEKDIENGNVIDHKALFNNIKNEQRKKA